MAVELAEAYVSLVVESSKISGQVEKSLAGLQPVAEHAGRGMGSRMASGIGATLKTTVAGVGLAAGAVLGTALTQGFKRLTAIDDAKGKLAGLGHQAAGVATIMDSALASVKGTAFGLGDAATIAASAVAAGVKPGQDLTRYLKLTADAATIAGTSLGDMGSIINKVTTSNKAYTGDLNMLSDRGIPIFQWLQNEYKVSADQLTKMVESGKVDSATFQKVIEKNIGGAALASGKTLTGAFSNMKAALGRVGEGALAPFLPIMKNALAVATEWADKVTPRVKAASTAVANGLMDLGHAFQSNGASVEGSVSAYERWGLRLRHTVDGIKGVWSILRSGEFKGSAMTFGLAEDSGVVKALFRIRDAAIALRNAFKTGNAGDYAKVWQALKGGTDLAATGMSTAEKAGHSLSGVLSKLGSATANVGKSLLSLVGDTGTVAAAGIQSLGSVMKFLADHTTLAVAALGAFVALQGVHQLALDWGNLGRGITGIFAPATLLATRAQTAALVAHNATMRAYLAAMGQELPAQQASMFARARSAIERARETVATRAAATALGQYAAAARVAAASSGLLVGSMQRAAAGALTLGARAQATAVTAFGGMRSAASGLMSMMGGPWGIAIAAGGAALLAHNAAADQAKRVQQALSDAVVQGAKAQTAFRDAVSASNGALNTNAVDAATKAVTANMAAITEVAKEGHSAWSSAQNGLFGLNEKLGGFGQGFGYGKNVKDEYDSVQRTIDQNETLSKVLKDQKLEMSDLGKVVAQGGAPYDELIAKLSATGDAGADVVAVLKKSRDELKGTQDAVKNSTPGFGALTTAIQTLSDTSATADDRLNAMKRALDVLSGKPIEMGDAMQQFNKELRETSQLAKEWDKADGFGNQLINPDGTINTKTVNGDKLRTQFQSLKDSVLDVAKAGGDLGPVFEQVNAKFAELSKNTGLNDDQLAALASTIGLLPKDIEILANVRGADKATQDLTAIKLLLDNNRQGATIDTKIFGSQEVIDRLRQAGAKVEEVTGKPGVFKVEAPNIQSVIDQVDKLIKAKIPDKQFMVWAVSQNADARQERFGNPSVQGPLPVPRATGGPGLVGAVQGAGGRTSDSIPAMLSRDEHVWTADETDAVGGHGNMYRLRSLALAGKLKFAQGGTPFGINEAIKAAQDAEGHKYLWGGVGPDRFDCSGFVGFLQQVAMGLGHVAKRLYTTQTLLDGSTAGLKPGIGPSGTFFQVGVSQEHMAATIAGQPVESGGALGTSGIGGGRAGASSSQFPNKFYLPNELISGIGNLTTGGKLIEWNEDDELQLLELQEAVTQAQEKRNKVYDNEKSSDSDKRKADLDVKSAQNKVVKKQEQKDKQGQLEGGTRVSPQAPGLQKRYNDDEKSYASDLQAVEQANVRRNEVYDNPDSTDTDKQVADIAYQDALDKLESGGDTGNSANKPKSVRDVLTNFASGLVGVAFDAFKAQLPSQIGGSHWWSVADQAISLASEYGDKKGAKNTQEALSGLPSFGIDAFLGQLGYNKAREIPEWAKNLKAPKVFDTGGWLMPGEMGINLSSSPEPIFNSASQLRDFAGSQLQPAQGGLTEQDVERIMRMRPEYHIHTNTVNDAIQAVRVEQKRQAATHFRR